MISLKKKNVILENGLALLNKRNYYLRNTIIKYKNAIKGKDLDL